MFYLAKKNIGYYYLQVLRHQRKTCMHDEFTSGLTIDVISEAPCSSYLLFVEERLSSIPTIAQQRDTGLVNAQHGALFGTDFINNRGHVGRWTRARTRLGR